MDEAELAGTTFDEKHADYVRVIEAVLDARGWSILRPVMVDQPFEYGQQIDSTDVAQVVVDAVFGDKLDLTTILGDYLAKVAHLETEQAETLAENDRLRAALHAIANHADGLRRSNWGGLADVAERALKEVTTGG